MAELKTRPTGADVTEFLATVPDAQKRADSDVLLELMKRVTGDDAVMWGSSIIGFGTYEYTNRSGKPAKWMATGFSPRKVALTIYIMQGFEPHADLMERLGKYKTGRSCLYVKRLSDIDLDVLETLVARSCEYLRQAYPKD